MTSDPASLRHWPLFGLRIQTPRLELRYPDDALVAELADLAAEGIHDPGVMPFIIPWTRQPAGVLERETMKHFWSRRSNFSPESWHLPLAVFDGGVLVGLQDVFSTGFPVTRKVETGSWLGQRFQGRGTGSEMRAAVLHLAFAGLGAEVAETGCFEDNPASAAVTRKLGYIDNGWSVADREGEAVRMLRFHLTRADWEARRRDEITVEGLEACLPLFGLA